MGSVSRAWVVGASVGLVEAMKDQGFCRWNYTLRSIHQHLLRSYNSSQPKTQLQDSLSSSSALVSADKAKAKQSEESLRKIMYLSCWGPN